MNVYDVYMFDPGWHMLAQFEYVRRAKLNGVTNICSHKLRHQKQRQADLPFVFLVKAPFMIVLPLMTISPIVLTQTNHTDQLETRKK